MVLAVYGMIHHLPALGQQYVLDSVLHRKTDVLQKGDILVSKLGCLWLLAQQRYRSDGPTEPARDGGHVGVPER
jgi:hypothetical protein